MVKLLQRFAIIYSRRRGEGMSIFLLLSGFCLIGLGFYVKKSDVIETKTPQEIEAFQESFYDQFEISQQQLKSLYAFDFEQVCQKLDGLVHSVNKLSTHLQEETKAHPLPTNQESPLTFTSEMDEKLQKLTALKQQGRTLDEMVVMLQMEKGELLFLENLSKSMQKVQTS